MEIFKLASQLKLRFQTRQGLLSTDQLWDLSLAELDALAVSLEIKHEQSAKKSFIKKTSVEDKTSKLKFDIVLDILNTKVAIEEEASKAMEIKKHNEKIIAIIAQKQDSMLQDKSIEELQAMLK